MFTKCTSISALVIATVLVTAGEELNQTPLKSWSKNLPVIWSSLGACRTAGLKCGYFEKCCPYLECKNQGYVYFCYENSGSRLLASWSLAGVIFFMTWTLQ